MNRTDAEQKRFDHLYQKHRTALILQGKSKSTLDLYSRPSAEFLPSLTVAPIVSALKISRLTSPTW